MFEEADGPKLSPAPRSPALITRAAGALALSIALTATGCDDGDEEPTVFDAGISDAGPGVHDAGISAPEDAGPQVFDAGVAPPDDDAGSEG